MTSPPSSRGPAADAPDPSPDFLRRLLEKERIIVLGHQHPDGDALGSAAALAAILRGLGKKAVVGISGRVPPNITFLIDPARYFFPVTKLDAAFLGSFERLVYVDCHGPSRVWPDSLPKEWDALPPNLVIDHHIHNEELRGAVGVFHDQRASSTGELVSRVRRRLGATLPPQATEALLTAIVTDTGFFTQENTTSSSLREAGDLLTGTGELARLHEKLNCAGSLARLRLLKCSLSSLELFFKGRVAVMLLTNEMLSEAGARVEDADGFIDYPRSLCSVLLAAFIKDDGAGACRVSLRSRPPVSARKIAQSAGGGGHELAAAYTASAKSALEAREAFLALARPHLPEELG
ncbi:MAG: DHH family phosphoesterase [Deltaproteobacteria bacterium]|jgi:phosphoesterase RecJ-like protein|nr:DHH family phosphoesterase [Deltaproteobacteria bacterium]